MSRDVLVALIAKDVKELNMLTAGIEEMDAIPAQYLQLALAKSKSLTESIQELIDFVETEPVAQDNAVAVAEEQRLREEELRRRAEAEMEKQVRAINEAKEAEEQARIEVERKAREEAERAEQARIEVERKAREEAERAEQARIEAERKAREEAERAEQARIEVERKAREEAERAEQARIEAERKAREEAERAEQARIEAEKKAAEDNQPRVEEVVDAVMPQARVTTVADAIQATESVLDKFSLKSDNETVASKIGSMKIDDIKSAITIVDRFRFQRELFDGNAEKMNRAIADLNAMSDMTQAEQYIERNFAGWSASSPAVVDFMELLHRKFD